MKIGISVLAFAAMLGTAASAVAEPPWDRVAVALGRTGTVQAGGVYRVGCRPNKRSRVA
jgi:hypothetical protein